MKNERNLICAKNKKQTENGVMYNCVGRFLPSIVVCEKWKYRWPFQRPQIFITDRISVQFLRENTHTHNRKKSKKVA